MGYIFLHRLLVKLKTTKFEFIPWTQIVQGKNEQDFEQKNHQVKFGRVISEHSNNDN